MNTIDILHFLFITFGLIYTVHFGLYIVGANLYDIRRFLRQAKGASKEGRRQRLPLVSVIVPAYNEELTIERCLDSIRKSKYPRLQAIVHSDNSTDRTVEIIRAYQKRYPRFDLRVIDRKKRAGKAGGVNYAARKYARGELIMTLDADCVLRKDAIRNAVRYFDDPKVVGVAANVRLMDDLTVLGILQQFEHLIGYRSKKFFTITNCEFIIGGVASTYRREILEKVGYYSDDTATEDIGLSMKIAALGNKQYRLVYGVDVVASTEGAHSLPALMKQRYRWKLGMLQNLLIHTRLVGRISKDHSLSLTLYRLPMAFLSELMLLAQPFIIAYILYLSLSFHTLGLFLGAYLVITLYVLATIWPDEHASVRKKVAQSFYAPIMYFTFYIMDFVQLVAIIRCLFAPKRLLRRDSTRHAAWTPPARNGQQIQFS